MKISLNWLSQYIDLSGLSVDEMSDMLTFAGIEVEDIRQQGVDSPYVVVARVAAAEQHPQADRLKVCQVDVGDGTLHQMLPGLLRMMQPRTNRKNNHPAGCLTAARACRCCCDLCKLPPLLHRSRPDRGQLRDRMHNDCDR